MAGKIIDREIHKHYRLYPGNYIADDLLGASTLHHTEGHYSAKELETFKQYIEGQLNKCPQQSEEVRSALKQQILLMYANPLRNHLLSITE